MYSMISLDCVMSAKVTRSCIMITVVLLVVIYNSAEGQEWLSHDVCFSFTVFWEWKHDEWSYSYSIYNNNHPPPVVTTYIRCPSPKYLTFKPTIDYIIPIYQYEYCPEKTRCAISTRCDCCTMPYNWCYNREPLNNNTVISRHETNYYSVKIQPKVNVSSCDKNRNPNYECTWSHNGITYYNCAARWARLTYKCTTDPPAMEPPTPTATTPPTNPPISTSTTQPSTTSASTRSTGTVSLTLSPHNNTPSTSPLVLGLVVGLIVLVVLTVCVIIAIICLVRSRKKAHSKQGATRYETPYEDVNNESELTPISEQTAQNIQHSTRRNRRNKAESLSQYHHVPDEEEYAVIDKTKKKKNIKQKKSNVRAKNENSGREYYNMVNIVPQSQANNSTDYEDTSITVLQDNKPNASNPTKGNNNNMVENTYYESQNVNKDRLLPKNQANDNCMMENPYYESQNVNKDRLLPKNPVNDDEAMMENPYYEGQQNGNKDHMASYKPISGEMTEETLYQNTEVANLKQDNKNKYYNQKENVYDKTKFDEDMEKQNEDNDYDYSYGHFENQGRKQAPRVH